MCTLCAYSSLSIYSQAACTSQQKMPPLKLWLICTWNSERHIDSKLHNDQSFQMVFNFKVSGISISVESVKGSKVIKMKQTYLQFLDCTFHFSLCFWLAHCNSLSTFGLHIVFLWSDNWTVV